MSQARTLAPPPRRPQQAPPIDFLSQIKTSGSGLPSRIVLHGVEGVGKTSFAAQAPAPIFGQSRGETGLETLIDSKQVKSTAHFPEWKTWQEAIGSLRQLVASDHKYETLVIDTLNGLERLCHEHVCNRDFKGDWTDKGFMGYMRGYEVALSDWRELLALLDQVRAKRIAIICLVHTRVARFSNPEGTDYDRYEPDMHRKTWGLTHKWADMVLFSTFYTVVDSDGKGQGGQERILYTERHAAYDAKNRSGLPESIGFGPDAATAWRNFTTAVQAARGAA